MWKGWAVTECKKDQSCVFERGKKGNGDNLWYENQAGFDFVFQGKRRKCLRSTGLAITEQNEEHLEE